MHHFLDNSGKRRTMAASDFTGDSGVDEAVREIHAELDDLAVDIPPGANMHVNISPRGVFSQGDELRLAVGSFTLSGRATIEKAGDGRVRHAIEYRVSDRYDWHPGDGGFAAAAAIVAGTGFQDSWAQLMVDGGVARAYDIEADWDGTTQWR